MIRLIFQKGLAHQISASMRDLDSGKLTDLEPVCCSIFKCEITGCMQIKDDRCDVGYLVGIPLTCQYVFGRLGQLNIVTGCLTGWCFHKPRLITITVVNNGHNGWRPALRAHSVLAMSHIIKALL